MKSEKIQIKIEIKQKIEGERERGPENRQAFEQENKRNYYSENCM